jgi:AraC-like DNA-binding protein/CheY-like chemotaxis protein
MTDVSKVLLFELAVRAHRFLLRVLPFRQPESQTAVGEFIEYVDTVSLPTPFVDAVLLRCLATLDRRSGGRLPTLVDRYVSHHRVSGCATRFRTIVEDVLKYGAIADPLAARAIASIDIRYAEAKLETWLAQELNVTARQLSDALKKTTGATTTEYIKNVRLMRAARLLVETNESKIWLKVGYGARSDSNFVHDFRNHFGITPSEYRRRSLPSTLTPAVLQHLGTGGCGPAAAKPVKRAVRVLIIDDDVTSIVATATFLRANGHIVACASNGEDGLREAASLTPDVVVAEHRLAEGMNGIDCLYALQRQRRGRPSASVLVTADWEVGEGQLRELRALVMHKPCDLEQIAKSVDYACS